MTMIEIKDFSTWELYDGFAEGSGRSEKLWLKSKESQIGLFKFPKIDPVDNCETTEHVSEHLAHKIGEILGVPTARVEIGTYNNRIGCMSYFVCESNEVLQEGIGFISGKYPSFNAETMRDEENDRYYCIEHILNSVPKGMPNRIWIEMMIFDFLIGNADRHQSNWALLVKVTVGKKIEFRLRQCPLYDNGSSLCCYVNKEQVTGLLGKDKVRFEALVDTKSLSMIRVDGTEKRRPTHRTVIEHLFRKYPAALEIASRFSEKLNDQTICALLDEYPEGILNAEKKELIRRYICRKLEIMEKVAKEVVRSETTE